MVSHGIHSIHRIRIALHCRQSEGPIRSFSSLFFLSSRVANHVLKPAVAGQHFDCNGKYSLSSVHIHVRIYYTFYIYTWLSLYTCPTHNKSKSQVVRLGGFPFPSCQIKLIIARSPPQKQPVCCIKRTDLWISNSIVDQFHIRSSFGRPPVPSCRDLQDLSAK